MLTKEEIKFIRSLHQKKYRKLHGKFIIEGPKMIAEALAEQPNCVHKIYTTTDFPILQTLDKTKIVAISADQLHQLSTLKQPQHLLAVCHAFEIKKVENRSLILALDNIQDPGNFGTILRLAAWFGIQQVLASENCVDCYNPKVVQASMGAIFNVQLTYLNLAEYFEQTTRPIYGALLEGTSVYKSQLLDEAILVVGNEGNGISEVIQKHIQHPIHIPKFGTGESLNVAMATGILVSEFIREK